MNRLATRVVLLLFMACAVSVSAAHAGSQLLFDYVGFDFEDPDNDPDFGAVNDGYQGVGEVPVINSPLSSDQTNFEYTYYFSGLIATTRTSVFPFVIIDYTDGTLQIFKDARVGGLSPFDYGTNPPNGTAPPSFVDGDKILEGTLKKFQYVYNVQTNTGSFEADFEATGGTQLGEIPASDRLGWTFSGVSKNSSTIPNGYDHQVDGQTFINVVTPTRSGSWGGIKARYR